MRLYSILKNSLKLTKKELNEYVKNHRITVNGDEVPFTSTIEDIDIVEIDGKRIQAIPFYYYLYYKPRGVLSTISKDPRSYIHQINLPHKVSPAGRLDKDSEGLMILSNDGKFLNEITGDSSILDKEYIVKVKYKITNEFIESMKKSYSMDGKMTTPAKVFKIDDYTCKVILYEGIYHQIRRLVKNSSNIVIELKRCRIGNYHLGNMAPNELIEFKP